MPIAITFTANLAPADMRGRYMSLFSLTWGVAQGIGPVAPWLGAPETAKSRCLQRGESLSLNL